MLQNEGWRVEVAARRRNRVLLRLWPDGLNVLAELYWSCEFEGGERISARHVREVLHDLRDAGQSAHDRLRLSRAFGLTASIASSGDRATT